MKKFLRICFVLCMILAMLPMHVSAENMIVTELTASTEARSAAAIDTLPQLGLPVNLKWSNGYMTWTMSEPHHFNAETKLYKVGQSEPISVFGHSWQNNTTHNFNAFHTYTPEDGASYYFTVQAISTNSAYSNSEIATSPTWTFVMPAEQMNPCSNVQFDGTKLTWTPPAGTNANTTYAYRFLYASDKNLQNGSVEHLNFMWGAFNGSVDVKQQNSWAYNDMKTGYYFTEVRAESNDINSVYHSPWAASNLVYFNGTTFEKIDNTLKLGSPIDLTWSNGYMNWTMTDPHHYNAQTKVYKVGQNEPIAEFGHSWQENNRHSFNALQTYMPEDGASYYFTVQAISTNSAYQNSDVVTSPVWTFVQPAETLSPCNDIHFDGENLTWTPPAGTNAGTTYAYRFLYASDKDLQNANVQHLNFMWGTFNGSADVKQQNPWAYNNMKTGYYFTEVRAESGDIASVYHGPWARSNLVYFNGSSFEIAETPHSHVFTQTLVQPNCTEKGYTLYSCNCGYDFSDNFIYSTGLHIFSNDQDTACDTCGYVREIRETRTVVHMFRMYDPNSGEHFYTGSEEERENLVAVGWNYEGVGFTFPLTTGKPVYRLYDRNNTFEHLYTMDEAEKNLLMSQGWEYEGIAFNSGFEDEVPQYRMHNPNETRGAYHFTSSLEERKNLLAAGWEYQGIGWYSCWK